RQLALRQKTPEAARRSCLASAALAGEAPVKLVDHVLSPLNSVHAAGTEVCGKSEIPDPETTTHLRVLAVPCHCLRAGTTRIEGIAQTSALRISECGRACAVAIPPGYTSVRSPAQVNVIAANPCFTRMCRLRQFFARYFSTRIR